MAVSQVPVGYVTAGVVGVVTPVSGCLGKEKSLQILRDFDYLDFIKWTPTFEDWKLIGQGEIRYAVRSVRDEKKTPHVTDLWQIPNRCLGVSDASHQQHYFESYQV